MHTYTDEQLARYLQHIGYRRNARLHAAEDPLGCLTTLQRLHMARVPFESLSLHYSAHRVLSLDPEDLFDKIVGKGRGGYCMEVNGFFAAVLRSLGYTLYSAGGRVKSPVRGYAGFGHMVNIVTIGVKRYMVDVGYGPDGAPVPVPLEHGYEFVGVAPVRGRLQYRRLEEHTDPNQRVWVYSIQENEASPWKDMYAFTEVEFFPEDFEVMNLSTMTSRRSFFVQSVVCVRTILDEEKAKAVGVLILHRDYVKRRVGENSEIIEKLESEQQRVKALEKYFGIVLSPQEQRAIRGLPTELKSRDGDA
ncbi:hypothetical protein VTK56DRAFT_2999 [Thermocarpiscus australiensis]